MTNQKIPLPSGRELMDFQVDSVIEMSEMGNVLLADEMGLGKTIQAAALVNMMRVGNPDMQILVVCPNSLRLNWLHELNDWLIDPPGDDVDMIFCTSGL